MSFQNVSAVQFEAALTEANVRQTQVIQGAIGMGILVFGIVVGVLYSTTHAEPTLDDVELIQTLTLAHLLILSGGVATANLLFRKLFSDPQLAVAADRNVTGADRQPVTDPALKVLAHVRSAIIVRLAILEAPALFGLVICLLMTINGVALIAPIYLLNSLSAAGFLVYVVTTFPNRERLVGIFNDFIMR